MRFLHFYGFPRRFEFNRRIYLVRMIGGGQSNGLARCAFTVMILVASFEFYY